MIVFASVTIKIILQIVASVHCGASKKLVDFNRTPASRRSVPDYWIPNLAEVCPAPKLEGSDVGAFLQIVVD